jgi:hypothetical protein
VNRPDPTEEVEVDIRNFGNTNIKTSAVVFGGGFVGGIGIAPVKWSTNRDRFIP